LAGCTGTATLSLLVADPTCSPFAAADFQSNGNTTYASNIYTLTPNQGNRNGSVWNKNRLFLDQDFDINARVYLGNSDFGFNAPKEIRSDTISLSAEPVRLRYVNCPEAPFSGDNDQNVCEDF
jgi:hypothetical protein